MIELFILTGASRGLGLAMACQLLAQGHDVLGLSRQGVPSPANAVHGEGVGTLVNWSVDLADPAPVAARLHAWLVESVDPSRYAGVSLINNAGVIPAIGPLPDVPADDLARALRVGLEAPMLLSSAFLRATQAWTLQRKVLNISSGLGRRAMASQATYCAAKAGMDHFTRCMALDEERKPHGARVCSLAPGVIDTDMQVQLRAAHPDAFPDVQNFAQLQSSGMLSSAPDAAARVLAWLQRPDFGAQPVADVRDA